MRFEKIHNKGQATLFQNSALEFLTKTHPLVIWGLYLPVIFGFSYYAASRFGFNAGRIAILFFAGMLFWTFFEYIMAPDRVSNFFAFGNLIANRVKKNTMRWNYCGDLSHDKISYQWYYQCNANSKDSSFVHVLYTNLCLQLSQ